MISGATESVLNPKCSNSSLMNSYFMIIVEMSTMVVLKTIIVASAMDILTILIFSDIAAHVNVAFDRRFNEDVITRTVEVGYWRVDTPITEIRLTIVLAISQYTLAVPHMFALLETTSVSDFFLDLLKYF